MSRKKNENPHNLPNIGAHSRDDMKMMMDSQDLTRSSPQTAFYNNKNTENRNIIEKKWGAVTSSTSDHDAG
jgi:hypothetical protein